MSRNGNCLQRGEKARPNKTTLVGWCTLYSNMYGSPSETRHALFIPPVYSSYRCEVRCARCEAKSETAFTARRLLTARESESEIRGPEHLAGPVNCAENCDDVKPVGTSQDLLYHPKKQPKEVGQTRWRWRWGESSGETLETNQRQAR